MFRYLSKSKVLMCILIPCYIYRKLHIAVTGPPPGAGAGRHPRLPRLLPRAAQRGKHRPGPSHLPPQLTTSITYPRTVYTISRVFCEVELDAIVRS